MYVAGVHHLRILQQSFTKEQHGLRERDLNHKDKQNYEAVLRMSSDSVVDLLKKFPDAKGTEAYLRVMRCVVESYLNKKLTCRLRIVKAWYAVFSLRYWRQWIILKKEYTLGNNFITLNAYMCVELNAHSLITFILTLRDIFPSESAVFLPWKLGSQFCEKIFGAARSMSSVFSTIINFGLLGLLRRLHRLHIQFCLEADSEESGIAYPRIETHKVKDGHNEASSVSSTIMTNSEIDEAVEEAREMAKMAITDLGMAEVLKNDKSFINPPIPVVGDPDKCTDDLEDDEVGGEECIADLMQEVCSSQSSEDVASGIEKLSCAGIIDEGMTGRLKELCTPSFKKVPSSTVTVFTPDTTSAKKKGKQDKHCPFVEVKRKKSLFIHKTTAVWLLQ